MVTLPKFPENNASGDQPSTEKINLEKLPEQNLLELLSEPAAELASPSSHSMLSPRRTGRGLVERFRPFGDFSVDISNLNSTR